MCVVYVLVPIMNYDFWNKYSRYRYALLYAAGRVCVSVCVCVCESWVFTMLFFFFQCVLPVEFMLFFYYFFLNNKGSKVTFASEFMVDYCEYEDWITHGTHLWQFDGNYICFSFSFLLSLCHSFPSAPLVVVFLRAVFVRNWPIKLLKRVFYFSL